MPHLPSSVTACLFDLDGVLTDTASVHRGAWKQMFDGFLRRRSGETGEPFVEFTDRDYERYVDGRPRLDGTRAFLASRGIELPEGDDDDPPGTATVHGLSNEKNALVLRLIDEDGVTVFDGSVRFVRRGARPRAAHRGRVLERQHRAGPRGRGPRRPVRGADRRRRRRRAGPRRQTGARHVPRRCRGARRRRTRTAAVFEDALAGVAAGRAGRFGFVVGVDRVGQRDALLERGADVVVDDLAELLPLTAGGDPDRAGGAR